MIYKGVNRIFTHDDIEKLKHLIENDYDETTASASHSSFSYKLDKYLFTSGIADLLEIFNGFITLILIIFYIVSTYTYPENGNINSIQINQLISNIQIFLCVFLITHFALKLYTNQNRLLFLFSFDNIIDSGTIAAILLSGQSFVVGPISYYLRFSRMVRIFYFFKLENILQRRTNETIRYSYKLIIYVLAVIFFSTGLILELENQAFRDNYEKGYSNVNFSAGSKERFKSYQFHDMFYFMLVTLSTIGYGDITPKTTLARFTVIVTILTMLAIVPTLFQKLLTILALTSKYSRISYNKYGKDTKHLLLLGSCSKEGFEAFLQELYHEDHGNVDYQTVIMQSVPDEAIMDLIKDSSLSNRIFYLVGNSLLHKDLERCKADTAECVVLLANKLTKDPKYEDFSNILQAFSVKKFAKIYSGNDVRICIQLLKPETKEIYFSSLVNKDDMLSRDQVICVEEIKLQLLGKSCLCPGINTIVSSLITSKKPQIEDVDSLPHEYQWHKEYLSGIQNEIYQIKLKGDIIKGTTFMELVGVLYKVSNIIMIGADVMFDTCEPFLCLNPCSYVFSPIDHNVYVLAAKIPDSNFINSQIEHYISENLKNNEEKLKLVNMKNPSWEKLKINIKEKHNSDREDEEDSFTEKNQKSIRSRLKKKDLLQTIKRNFIQTTFPRTEYETENFSNEILDKHIIVCGLIPNMKNLIYPLRATSMKNSQHPILIIDKDDHIPSEIWKEIQYFPEIYFMQGNPIKSRDLHRACIKKAKAVIILTKNNFETESHEMIDADTIFIYKAIRNENKDVLVIADLASISTIGFISNTDENKSYRQSYRLSEQFALGEIYTGSMLDTLMCQAFYYKYITDILQQMILGNGAFTYSQEKLKQLQEKKVVLSNLYLLKIHDEIEKLEKFKNNKPANQGSLITFEELFNYFTSAKMLPLGIFRNFGSDNNNKGEKTINIKSSNKDKYVYMAPAKDTLVNIENDRIYVLASEEEVTNNIIPYIQKDNKITNPRNIQLIAESKDIAGTIIEDMKKLINFNRECFSNNLSVKKIIDSTRHALRKELSNIYDIKINHDIAEDDVNHSEYLSENLNSKGDDTKFNNTVNDN